MSDEVINPYTGSARPAAPPPDPRSVRENDSLGRAGRVSQKGNAIEVVRKRDMTVEDARRAVVETGVFEHPRLVVTENPPHSDVLLAESDDDHRGMQHLDGNAEPRPPEAWERANSELRAGKFASEREAMTRSLRRRRADQPTDQRLRAVLQRLLTFQSQGAQQYRATDAKGAADSKHVGPQGGRHGDVGHADPFEVDKRLRMIALLVESLEEIADEHDGLAHTSYDRMDPGEKDALLTGPKFRGLDPEVVAVIRPELGKARAIAYVRRLADQRRDGTPAPQKEAAA